MPNATGKPVAKGVGAIGQPAPQALKGHFSANCSSTNISILEYRPSMK